MKKETKNELKKHWKQVCAIRLTAGEMDKLYEMTKDTDWSRGVLIGKLIRKEYIRRYPNVIEFELRK